MGEVLDAILKQLSLWSCTFKEAVHISSSALGYLTLFEGPRGQKDGVLVFLPVIVRKGDVVAVFTGSLVPIILRPQKGHHTVVGDSYVHGLMDDEAMQAGDKLEYIELR